MRCPAMTNDQLDLEDPRWNPDQSALQDYEEVGE
jgi:hypothetical protein